MRDRWEETLEEMCGSPAEELDLKETAALFERLPEPSFSLSFRQELKDKLLAEAAEKIAPQRKTQRRWGLLSGLQKLAVHRVPRWSSRSFGLVTAGLLLFFLALSIFNHPAPRPQEPLALNMERRQEQRETSMLSPGAAALPSPGAELSPSLPQQNETTEKPESSAVKQEQGSQAPAPPPAAGSSSGPGTNPAPPAERPAVPANEPAAPPVLPAEPEFELLRQLRTFALTGNPVLHYGPLAEALYPVEKVNVSWEPNKIAPAATPEVDLFGTPEWAERLLALEGFRLKTGEKVSVSVKETTQGLYAEIVYHLSPAVILHVHESKGVIAYYYQESGAVAPAGYYALLAPADALKQLQRLQGSVEGQQLRFSFREVKFTYHDFLLEDGEGVKTARLPAYGFTGSELLQGREGVTFYLPAIALK